VCDRAIIGLPSDPQTHFNGQNKYPLSYESGSCLAIDILSSTNQYTTCNNGGRANSEWQVEIHLGIPAQIVHDLFIRFCQTKSIVLAEGS